MDRSAIEPVERRRELVDPLDREPVLEKRVVLAAQRRTLAVVRSEPQASDASEGVARQLLHAVERAFREGHHETGTFDAEQPAGLVVRRRGTAQREASVAAARAAGDLPGLVEPHANAALGEGERTRAAGHAAPDHRDLGTSRELAQRQLVTGLCEPV